MGKGRCGMRGKDKGKGDEEGEGWGREREMVGNWGRWEMKTGDEAA